MNPHRWQATKQIFGDALRRTQEERSDFLADKCGSDVKLRRAIEHLLEEHSKSGEFIEPSETPKTLEDIRESLARPPMRELGDFKIERELGRGGMGIVYLATQKSLGRSVVIKVLRPEMGLSDLQVERFKREATAAAKLRHRGVATIQAVGEENGVHYFAMDYIEGRSLDVILAEARDDPSHVDPERWAKIAMEIAEALQYAHQQGVIHRDVKPHNVLVDSEGEPYLIDFGLAKIEELSSLSRSGDIAGTPYYMSPEQALAKRVRVDHRTDIFSLGVVLFEMLAGRRPFDGETQQDILFGITFKDPPPLRELNPKVSRELEAICFKALEKNPQDRYESARDLAVDLHAFLAGDEIQVRPPSLFKRLARWKRKHPRTTLSLWVALALCVVVATTVGVTSFFSRLDLPTFSVDSGVPFDRVYLQPIDYLGFPRDDEELIGETPLTRYRLEEGYYRITVERGGFGFAEVIRLFDKPRENYMLTPQIKERLHANSGMRLIKGGRGTLGSGPATQAGYHEQKVEIDPFYLDEREVSNREYKRFCDETRHDYPIVWCGRYDEAWNSLPVTGVTYHEARAYAEWVGKRLPTTFEWGWALRGPEGLEDFEGGANLGREDAYEVGLPDKKRWELALSTYLENVKSVKGPDFVQGPNRLYHMIGNVGEWTDTIVLAPAPDGGIRPQVAMRVIRGGNWTHKRGPMVVLAHWETPVAVAGQRIGFRCAMSARGRP